MKKRILFACLAIILLFSGCTVSFEFGTRPPASPAESEPLTFMIPRNWLEEHPTPELQRSIDQIQQLIDENPYMGPANDFWVNHIGTNRQTMTFTWLAVNRTGRAIQNISFDLTFFRAGELYTIPIELTEEFIGVIPNQAATVFMLNLPIAETFEYFITLLNDAMDGTASMTLENAEIDFAD